MSACSSFALPSARSNSSHPKFNKSSSRVGRAAIGAALSLTLLCALAGQAWAAPAATTTVLATSNPGDIQNHPVTTFLAKVWQGKSTSSVTQGLVRFYDGKQLLGSAQIANTGVKFPKYVATLSYELAPGNHMVKAVFVGTSVWASSASSAQSLTVQGSNATSAILSATGEPGNYALTVEVPGLGATAPTGTVNFFDYTMSDEVFGTATLGAATGKPGFSAPAGYPVYQATNTPYPVDIAVGDFNGDGILDLAVLEAGATRVSISLGNADGTFQSAQPFCTIASTGNPCSVGSEPSSIAVADFNSDGIPDLAVASGNFVSVALGNGDGTFQQPVNYTTALGGNQVRVADLNQDGTPDLVVSVSGGISVLLGNGDGTFQPHTDVATTKGSNYIAIGDFNKDGIPDVVAMGFNGSYASVLLGNGDGTFQPEMDSRIKANPAGCAVVAVDLKGSGFASDIAYCGSGRLETAFGDGKGNFSASQELFPNPGFSQAVSWVAAADLNGDGGQDLLLTWYAGVDDKAPGHVAVFANKNDGSGTFPVAPVSYLVGVKPQAVVAGDFNGDGLPDLASVNYGDQTATVLLASPASSAVATLKNAAVPGWGAQTVYAEYLGDKTYTGGNSNVITLTGSQTPAPSVTTLKPATIVAGSAGFTLQVNGAGFASGATINWNGNPLTTTFNSATVLTASVPASNVAAPATIPVTVTLAGVTSIPVNFAVTPAAGAPTFTSIVPNFAVTGSSNTTVAINGAGFSAASAAYVGGSLKLATTYVGPTQLTAVLPASQLAKTGMLTISVVNGKAASLSLPFTVGPALEYPLAYGYFDANGKAGATSGNIGCSWVPADDTYLCAITGTTFVTSQYVADVTLATTGTTATAGVQATSGGGISIRLSDPSGTAVQEPFYIVVYKP